jgi:hypothetical protein
LLAAAFALTVKQVEILTIKIFAIILVSIYSFGVNSQPLVNQNHDDNSLIYRGFDNSFLVVGEPNLREKDYSLKCQNCVIKTESWVNQLSENSFNINTKGRKNSILSIIPADGDTIEYLLRAHNLPDGIVHINDIHQGESLAPIFSDAVWDLNYRYPSEILLKADYTAISWECTIKGDLICRTIG